MQRKCKIGAYEYIKYKTVKCTDAFDTVDGVLDARQPSSMRFKIEKHVRQ